MNDKTGGNRDMNKTAITLGYFALAVVCIIGVIAAALFRPEAMDGLVQFVGTIMAVASTGAVTFYMLGKQDQKVDRIQHQTNGTLSALREENAELTRQLIEAHAKSAAGEEAPISQSEQEGRRQPSR